MEKKTNLTKLLIIDPQNDFSEYKEGVRSYGPLGVSNSNNDYENIAKLISSGKFDEIHVSLDTHTPYHIGHAGFYKNANLTAETYAGQENENLVPVSDLKNTNVIDYPIEVTKPATGIEQYMNTYRKLHENKGPVMLWPYHCIENSIGHQIVNELIDPLDKQKDKVKYHIKGQNEMAEMYSIFSAAVTPDMVGKKNGNTIPYRYQGNIVEIDKHPKAKQYKTDFLGTGVNSYKDAINCVNLEVNLNTKLLDKLLEEDSKVYICGEAKSHCVKDSAMDMLKYKNGAHKQQIFLLKDCTSPVKLPDSVPNASTLNKIFLKNATELEEAFGGNITTSTEFLESAQTAGKRSRTRKRSKRKRTQRKQKRSQRKRTRRSRR